mmetsp:Transcript_47933/g.113465  ORF Transcript_47933/g.113465 Transcript_47933/m.113465 type:complete len:284 (-) Transcript_47933:1040-1891(-)
MLADDHARVHLHARAAEELTTRLQLPERVDRRRARLHRHQHTLPDVLQVALVRLVSLERARHDAGAARVREEDGTVAEEAAGGALERDTRAASLSSRRHVGHDSLALRELVDHCAAVLLVDLDDNLLDGLQPLAVVALLVEHLGRAHAQLEALSPHVLHQDTQLELAAAHDVVGLRALLRRLHRDSNVVLALRHQPVADHLGGQLRRGLVLASEGRVVGAEGHGEGRGVDGLRGEGLLHAWRADGVRHSGLGEPCDLHDVAGACVRELHLARALASENLGDAA